MLDGGFEQWKKEGLPVETKTNPPFPSHFVGNPDKKVLATFKTVKNSLRNNDSVIVDARTKEEFTGKHVRAAKAGHIPSAINIDWEQNIKKELFKSPDQLRLVYSSIPKNAKIITYCQGGYRAANSFLALKTLGYKNVKLYLGSWGEWGNKTDSPIEESEN
jgi:thiosulfate/3-mercaptopyruvate sulfurtransferase